jgi:hypothetical protein
MSQSSALLLLAQKLGYALLPQPGGFEGSVAISEVPDRSDLSLAYGDHGADRLIDSEATALAANCVTTLDEDLIPAEVRDILDEDAPVIGRVEPIGDGGQPRSDLN